MNFSRFDVTVIVVMSLAIVSMSFVFPALGLTGQNAQENNIPEFNTTAEAYQFNESFPRSPGTDTSGELQWYEREPQAVDNQQVFLTGGPSDGFALAITNAGNQSDPEPQVFLENWTDGSGVSEDSYTLSNTSDVGVLNSTNGNWTIGVSWIDTANRGTQDLRLYVEFQVSDYPTQSGNIIAQIYNGLEGVVAYIGNVLYWLVAMFSSIVLQVFVLLFDILVYIFGTFHWLTTAYWALVDGATGFASVFVVIPGVLLFAEFAKLAFLGVDVLWLG